MCFCLFNSRRINTESLLYLAYLPLMRSYSILLIHCHTNNKLNTPAFIIIIISMFMRERTFFTLPAFVLNHPLDRFTLTSIIIQSMMFMMFRRQRKADASGSTPAHTPTNTHTHADTSIHILPRLYSHGVGSCRLVRLCISSKTKHNRNRRNRKREHYTEHTIGAKIGSPQAVPICLLYVDALVPCRRHTGLSSHVSCCPYPGTEECLCFLCRRLGAHWQTEICT